MEFKRNMTRRAPTEDEMSNLTFPKDKFDLISVDYVDEWDVVKTDSSNDNPDQKKYLIGKKAVHITVKCKKCGTVKHEATDRPDMSCKTGPCISTWVDLTGKKFGNLTVIKLDHSKLMKGRNNRRWYWLCECSCGKKCFKTTADLSSHYHRMCPSCARKSAVIKTTLVGQKSKWNRMIRVYKKNATTRSREFSLTDEEFFEISSRNCAYCGKAPVCNAYGVVSNGIDRIDSSRGYTSDNVVACCKECNRMKGKMSVGDFLAHVNSIHSFSSIDSKLNDHPEREYISSEVEMGVSQNG